jgi:3-methyladenine DNA glycosylase AlkD
MTSTELIAQITDYCKANANEANVVKYSHYFKGGNLNTYGLTTPQIYKKVKELLKTPGMSLEIVLKALPTLIKSDKSEEITFALLLVNGFGKQYSKTLFKEIENWYRLSITNWAHADTLGMFILPQFINRGVVHYTDFSHWLISNHKFQRRSVPVTLIKLIKAKKMDTFTPLFLFIEPLMTDPEREVHQGTGWFLREAWKINRKETEEFLFKWKDTAPRLIIQYATEKMSTSEKQRFKKRT